MTSTVTTDFREEYEAARETWLRKRFLWYAGVVGGFILLFAMVNLLVGVGAVVSNDPAQANWIQFGERLVRAALYLGAFTLVLRRSMDRAQMIRWVSALIIINGMMVLLVGPTIVQITVDAQQHPGAASAQQVEAVKDFANLFLIVGVLMTHLIASLFIPWTPREAVRPMIPLLGAYAIMAIFLADAPLWGRLLAIALSPLAAGPGVLIAAWRNRGFKQRFHLKMLKGRYGEIKKDLGFAREIHEAMFPRPLLHGPVRFDYRYEPMRQIGGDYLFSRVAEEANGRFPILNLAIVDVTGHGIGAALTVNRLHGEISRQFGEKPEARPGELLTGLNDYLHHTLSTHSVYATAIFLRFNPNAGELSWASAGHPPAFLKAVDGTIERLDSTTLVLGACKGDDFDPHEESTRFTPGDALIAYTDGATEARDEKGRMLGVEGLLRIIASCAPDEEGGWASSVLREVDHHRFGPVQDDTLIVEIFRPLQLTSEATIEAVTR